MRARALQLRLRQLPITSSATFRRHRFAAASTQLLAPRPSVRCSAHSLGAQAAIARTTLCRTAHPLLQSVVIGSVLRTGFWSRRLSCKFAPTCVVPVGRAPGFPTACHRTKSQGLRHFKQCRYCVCHRDTIDHPCTMLQASPPSQGRHGWDAFWGLAQSLGTCPNSGRRDLLQGSLAMAKASWLTTATPTSKLSATRWSCTAGAQGGVIKNKFLLIKSGGTIVSSRAVLRGDMKRLRLVSDEDKEGQCVVSDTFAKWRSGPNGSDANFQLQQCCDKTFGLLCERLELPGSKASIARFVPGRTLA